MIKKIQELIESIKSSAFGRLINRIITWFKENVIKRKLIVFMILLTAWLSLLLSAKLSPQRQLYSAEELETQQAFDNQSGEIELVSQRYSPETGLIVLQFETQDATSSINRGIDTKRLDWKLYAKNASPNTTMDVVPIIDNKISVIIRHVPKDFGAYAIDVTNRTVVVNDVDVDIDRTPEDSKTKKVSSKETKSTVQFFVTKQNKELKTKAIHKVTREEFTLSEISQELAFQKGQKTKLTESVDQLKRSIKDDEDTKSTLMTEAKYLTGDDLLQNQNDIETLETNIESKNQSIDTATQNREKVKEKIASLKKKEIAVKDGTFEFANPIETIQKN